MRLLGVGHEDLLAVDDDPGEIDRGEHRRISGAPGRLDGLGHSGAAVDLDHAGAHDLAHHVHVDGRITRIGSRRRHGRRHARLLDDRFSGALPREQFRASRVGSQHHREDRDQHREHEHGGTREQRYRDRATQPPPHVGAFLLLEHWRRRRPFARGRLLTPPPALQHGLRAPPSGASRRAPGLALLYVAHGATLSRVEHPRSPDNGICGEVGR